MEDEIFCVAAPILDRAEKPVAAISIASIYLKMDEQKIDLWGNWIAEAALAISRRLGFSRNQLFF
jgi:DNA-binding IclR family transcriptional regulator